MGGTPDAERRSEEADGILRESNAILSGDHFVYVTGEHGDGWIDKDAIFPHTDRISRLAELLAEALAGRELVYLTEVEIPSSPADECRLCREGVPVNTQYAHGADFLAAQR